MPADMAKRTNPAPAIDPEISPGLRRFLYGTAAITGACVLVVEILGAKMLSPYFGTSHFVWTAQIAVTLLALAAGYYLGGRWSITHRVWVISIWQFWGRQSIWQLRYRWCAE